MYDIGGNPNIWSRFRSLSMPSIFFFDPKTASFKGRKSWKYMHLQCNEYICFPIVCKLSPLLITTLNQFLETQTSLQRDLEISLLFLIKHVI